MSNRNNHKTAKVPGNNKSRKASILRSFVMPGSNASILGAAVITAAASLLIGYFSWQQKARVMLSVPRTQPSNSEFHRQTQPSRRAKRLSKVRTADARVSETEAKRMEKQAEPPGVAAMTNDCTAQDFRLRRCYQNLQGANTQNPQGARTLNSDTEDPL